MENQYSKNYIRRNRSPDAAIKAVLIYALRPRSHSNIFFCYYFKRTDESVHIYIIGQYLFELLFVCFARGQRERQTKISVGNIYRLFFICTILYLLNVKVLFLVNNLLVQEYRFINTL
jgi:hypothetical protein